MLRDGDAIGRHRSCSRDVESVAAKQVELLETFADQAVIAIENTRLFEEVQARTAELTESLEYQTATSEVLGVISRAPNEVQPVLDSHRRDRGAALQCRLQPDHARRRDGTWYAASLFGHSDEYAEYLSASRKSSLGGAASPVACCATASPPRSMM